MKSGFLKLAKELAYPLALMCNTVIGIGIFSLPYAASKVGLDLMLAYFFVIGGVVYLIHLMFAQIALKTPDFNRLPGFARIYLGPGAEAFVSVCVIAGLIGAMVAFTSIGGEFLYNVANPWLGGSQIFYGIVYLLSGSLLVYFGINVVKKIEFYGLLFFLAIMAFLLSSSWTLFKWDNILVKTGGTLDIFLPYGPLLFSLWGASSIPEIEEMLGAKRKKKLLPLVISISLLLSLAVYIIFTFSVVGFTGAGTAQTSLAGFEGIFSPNLLNLAFVLGLITTFTSFVIIGLTFKKILQYDFSMPANHAWLITTALPLFLFVSGLNNYMAILSIVGGITLSLEGLIILAIYKKIRPDRALWTYPLALFFISGIVYEIYYYFKLQ